ncbi:Xrn1, helical domain, partial [Dillenia turbinata]
IQQEREKRFQHLLNLKNSCKDKKKKRSKSFSSSNMNGMSVCQDPEILNQLNMEGVNSTTDNPKVDEDKVKLGEDGWKERYYAEKFEATTNADREKFRGHAVGEMMPCYLLASCFICFFLFYYSTEPTALFSLSISPLNIFDNRMSHP